VRNPVYQGAAQPCTVAVLLVRERDMVPVVAMVVDVPQTGQAGPCGASDRGAVEAALQTENSGMKPAPGGSFRSSLQACCLASCLAPAATLETGNPGASGASVLAI
jgi:hypothetical protein